MKICLSTDLAAMLRDPVERIAPDAEIVELSKDGRFSADPSGIEALLFSTDIATSNEAMAAAAGLFAEPKLRWVQSPGAGVDHPIWAQLLSRGVRLSSAAGIHAEPIAQYIFTYILHWERNVARHQRQQQQKHWEIIVSEDLTSKTLGIVGLGGIGSAAARVAKAFGMRVLATKRSPVEDPNVDRILKPEALAEMLSESDYVVVCVPLIQSTKGLIGAQELAAMRKSAVLINVARGDVVDETALIATLEAEAIRGATLDVVSQEPLPPDSPLWTMPNCVLTPHDAGYSPRAGERLAGLFADNLSRYVGGETLINEVFDVDLPGPG